MTHKIEILRPRFAAVLLLLAGSALPAPALSSNLTWKAEASVKQTYDDNVYIQNTTPAAANIAAAQAHGLNPVQANKSSLVTTIQPRLTANYKPAAEFNAAIGYAPDIALYASAEDENYVAHRATLNFNGKIQDASWEWLNSENFVQGGTLGPTFARGQDVPAVGGIPLRDRREQFVDRNSFRVTIPAGDWFIRPVASGYYHDFFTQQRLNPANVTSNMYCYENYLDRQDVNGGVDIGYDVGKKTYLVLGFRYGRQDQFVGPNAANTAFTDSPYDSSYERALFGIEGSPAPWLKLTALGGPEFRQWDEGTPAAFNRNQIQYWVDASATVIPDKNDTVTVQFRRFLQPAFSSQSVYNDITYSATWKHAFNEHFSASAGFQLYIGDWLPPVNRDDWIYTPSAGMTYAYNRHLSADLTWSYDIAENKTPTSAQGAAYAEGREYNRNLFSLAVKYTF